MFELIIETEEGLISLSSMFGLSSRSCRLSFIVSSDVSGRSSFLGPWVGIDFGTATLSDLSSFIFPLEDFLSLCVECFSGIFKFKAIVLSAKRLRVVAFTVGKLSRDIMEDEMGGSSPGTDVGKIVDETVSTPAFVMYFDVSYSVV